MALVLGHPYFPENLVLHNFVTNEQDLSSIASKFIAMWVAILASVWYISSFTTPKSSRTDKSIVLWFTLCGTLHCFFEGFFVFNQATLGSGQSLFAQLWKEYALSDSRYLSGDPTVLCAEAITVFVWGPLCFTTAILILVSSPYRHALQAMISLAHIYGDVLYISTSLADLYFRGVSYCRPEPCYFWFYFLFLNLIWIFVPAVLLYQSTVAIADAFLGRQQFQDGHKNTEAEQLVL